MKTLAILNGGIGDCILSLPAVRFINADQVWCPAIFTTLIRDRPSVAIESTGIDLLLNYGVEYPGLMKRFRDFDVIYSWFGTNSEVFRKEVDSLPFRFCRGASEQGVDKMSASDFLLKEVGARYSSTPFIMLTGEDKQDLVILHPFSGSSAKNFQINRFMQLQADLCWRGIPVRFCVPPGVAFNDAAVVRHQTLWHLARWIGTASVYVGNDSGCTHLAASLGVPTIALFGPASDPDIWAPRGSHVKVFRCGMEFRDVTNKQIMEEIHKWTH